MSDTLTHPPAPWIPRQAEPCGATSTRPKIVPAHALAAEFDDDLAALEGEWRRLEDAVETLAPELTWRFSASWAAAGERIEILTVRDGSRIVGIWPLALERRFGLRVLRRAGAALAPYDRILIAPQADAGDVMEACASRLADRRDVDLLDLPTIRAGSPILALAHPGWNVMQTGAAARELRLNEFSGFQTFDASSKSKHRREARRTLRCLDELGDLAFDIVHGDEAVRDLDVAFAMKRAWLRENGLWGSGLRDERVHRVLAALAEKDDPSCRTRMSRLSLNGTPIAVEIALASPSHHGAFLGTFDLDHGSHGPGVLQMRRTIETLFELGATVYDLLPPDCAYKARIAPHRTAIWRGTLPLTSVGHVAGRVGALHLRHKAKMLWQALPLPVRRNVLDRTPRPSATLRT